MIIELTDMKMCVCEYSVRVPVFVCARVYLVCLCVCVFLLVHAFAWNIQHFAFAREFQKRHKGTKDLS